MVPAAPIPKCVLAASKSFLGRRYQSLTNTACHKIVTDEWFTSLSSLSCKEDAINERKFGFSELRNIYMVFNRTPLWSPDMHL